MIVYYCSYCNEHTMFEPLYIHIIPDEGPPEEYTFSKCEKCKKPAIFYRENMGDGFESDLYYRIFPEQERHIGYLLPPIVRTSYEEAVKCEGAHSWIAAVTMIGRTLEAVIKDYDPNQKSLFNGLKKMQTDGAISNELYEWANELRVIRNYGAHATDEPITEQDAHEALDFLQTILEILYYMRPKFKEMITRRIKV